MHTQPRTFWLSCMCVNRAFYIITINNQHRLTMAIQSWLVIANKLHLTSTLVHRKEQPRSNVCKRFWQHKTVFIYPSSCQITCFVHLSKSNSRVIRSKCRDLVNRTTPSLEDTKGLQTSEGFLVLLTKPVELIEATGHILLNSRPCEDIWDDVWRIKVVLVARGAHFFRFLGITHVVCEQPRQ